MLSRYPGVWLAYQVIFSDLNTFNLSLSLLEIIPLVTNWNVAHFLMLSYSILYVFHIASDYFLLKR